MKNKAQKQKDLDALAEQFKNANAAMLVSFKNMTVAKDQELRRQLREAGVSYSVVKNTLARKASAGTPLEPMADQFKGVTAVALSANDPVGLSKAISKFTKANPDIFSFKVGLVEGKVVELKEVESIASLPSREDLLSKVLFLINAQAQRLVTVLQAVPRNLAVVTEQVRAQKEAQGAWKIWKLSDKFQFVDDLDGTRQTEVCRTSMAAVMLLSVVRLWKTASVKRRCSLQRGQSKSKPDSSGLR